MRKDTFLLVVGALIFIAPFLGIPESWRSLLLFVLGGLVLLVAVSCRLTVRRTTREERDAAHIETVPDFADHT